VGNDSIPAAMSTATQEPRTLLSSGIKALKGTSSVKLTTYPCIVSQNVVVQWLSLLLRFVLGWSHVRILAWICATFINVFVSPSSLRQRIKVDHDRFPARSSQLLTHNHLLFYGI
jgi:hypothetical protein